MQRYFMQLAYKGTHFHGWQIQPNAKTVQEELNKAVSVITGEQVNLVGAGRTDTGVHASFFVAHFDLERPLADATKFAYQLNGFLGKEIRVDKVFEVEPDMHARFSALSRTYQYYLSNRKELFKDEFCAYVPYPLNVEQMNRAAQILFEYTDFTSFSKLHTDVKTNNCKMMKALWKYENGLLVFEIKADRFLRNMVRAVVGTLIEVGREKITIDQFRSIIENQNRGDAGASVFAKGLFLTDIEYPDEVNLMLMR